MLGEYPDHYCPVCGRNDIIVCCTHATFEDGSHDEPICTACCPAHAHRLKFRKRKRNRNDMTKKNIDIERGEPLRIHKNLVIRVLRNDPASLPQVMPEWKGTAKEAIAALERHSGEWFEGGVLDKTAALEETEQP